MIDPLLTSKLEAHADALENENWHQAAAALREAIKALEPYVGALGQRLTYGELAIGDHWISWPSPGDNSGHGGYLRGSYVFKKLTDDMSLRLVDGNQSSCNASMHVLKVILAR